MKNLYRPLLFSFISTLIISSPAYASTTIPGDFQLEWIGEETIPTGYRFDNLELGGLSGIDYDERNHVFIALSDDRGQKGPIRFYELTMDLSDGSLDSGDIQFKKTVEILDKNGKSFPTGVVDPESIRLSPFPDILYWSSEGDARKGISPFVRIMTRSGEYIDEFKIPEWYKPTADSGIRNNLAFESLTFSTSTGLVITATENALIQDGPKANLHEGSPSRVLALYRDHGHAAAEYLYETDPVPEAPIPADGFNTNGLVELLTIEPYVMIAVERAYSAGVGNTIKLYLTSREHATNILGLDSIEGKEVEPMPKRLLLNLNDLGIPLDNIEGITFGPRLPSGERTLILVSDNNFNPKGQFTQFLAFKIIE